ncbi:MAG: hypothetical protein GY788_11275 [bacterium]|nr:hypothetical protein [bacterium]
MTHERPPLALRPVHRWFQWWESVAPSLYRVVAVVVAIAPTVLLIRLTTRAQWLIAVVIASAVWIALAMIQERDACVVSAVDGEFLSLLRSKADPVLDRAGFTFKTALGPARARGDSYDTFLYEAATDDGRVDLWITRDRSAGGDLEVLMNGRSLERLLESRGGAHLARRITRTDSAAADVAALVAAFELVFTNEDLL